jgi:glycosyltransferase involved in cell wall biosynthesis
MRIAVDVSPLSHPRTGIGNYLVGTVDGLVRVGADRHEIVPFAPTSLRGPDRIRAALDGIPAQAKLWPLPASHALRTAWSRIGRPAAERLVGTCDALLYTDWMYPPQRAGLRTTIVHDLVRVHHPEWCTRRTIAMHTRKYDDAARTCDVIFTNSRYTADDVASTLGVCADRLVVVPPGVRDGLGVEGPVADLGRPYLLALATMEPRKNLGALVDAWRLFEGDRALALAGGAGWGEEGLQPEPGLLRLGYFGDAAVPRLLRGADAFVFPSLFEGFGIPVVEAMACGIPVVASSHPSLDEACGDAAVRVDPRDPAAIADGIREALLRREELVPAGLVHASSFTWEKAATTMLAALEERA